MMEIPSRWLEFLNGVQFVLGSGLVVACMAYLLRKWNERGSEFWITVELKMGWSLMVLFTGDTMTRGIIWYARHVTNHGGPLIYWPTSFTIVTAFSTVVWSWGGICLLRMIAPHNTGEWSWVFIVAGAIVAAALLAI